MEKKTFRRVNRIVTIALAAFCVAFLICFWSLDFRADRIPACVGVALVALIPFALEWIFRIKFSNFIWLAFNVLYVVAGVLGSIWGFYGMVPFYDKVVHGLVVGYGGSMLGLMLLNLLGEADKLRPVTIALFCLFLSATFGVLWEIYEYCADLFLGQSAQGSPIVLPDGTTVRSLTDTMGDFIANTTGGLVFTAHFALHKLTGKNLMMGSMIADFREMRPKKEFEKNS